MLKRIEIEHFKKHRSLKVDFSSGTNLIVGPNWAGKSTVLWAVVFALYGPSAVPGGSKLVAPQSGGGKTSVKLWMSMGGRQYRILRTADKAELYRDEVMVANGASTVSKTIEDLLSMSPATFLMLRMAPQNESAAILTLGTTKLSQVVDKITRVDVVDRIITEAAAQTGVLQGRLDQTQTPDLARLEEELVEAIQQRTLCQANLSSAIEAKDYWAADLAQRNLDWQRLNGELQHYYAEQTRVDTAKRDRAVAAGKLELLRPTAALPEQDIEELAKAAQEWSKLCSLEEAAKQEQARLVCAGRDLAETVQWAESRVKEYWADSARVSELTSNVSKLVGEVAALEHGWRALSSAEKNSSCPTCRRPFEGHNLAALETEKAATEVSLKAAGEALKETRKELAALSERAATFRNVQQQESALRAQVNEHQKQFLYLNAQVSQLCSSLGLKATETSEPGAQDAAYALRNAAEQNRKRNEAVAECHKLEQVLAQCDKLLSSLAKVTKPSEETLKSARDLVNTAAEQAAYAAETHLQASLASQAAESTMALVQQALREGKAAEAAARELESNLDLHKQLVKYLRKNREVFTARVWDALLQSCSAFVSSATCGQVTEVSRTTDGQFQYREGGAWMPVAAASGVQQAILGVGVRLALAAALGASCGFLLLDEVTAGAHDDLSLEIVRALADSSDQLLIVDHRQADAAVADTLIHL